MKTPVFLDILLSDDDSRGRQVNCQQLRPILYITRNGMCEPLGQSQVLAYLRGLSRDYAITLISFEKPEDRADRAAMERVRADCSRHGIRWLPQSFHHRPKGLAPAWGMLVLLWLCLREARRGNADLVHARSYVPAAVALVVRELTGTPFFFDMRALWPEELITAGRLRRGSPLHRAIVRVERACLSHAAAVVSLTRAAVDHLRETYPDELSGQRVEVIPTCADLDRFSPAPVVGGPAIYGCAGTVLSGWFQLDWLTTFFEVVSVRDPNATFEVVTRENGEAVRTALSPEAEVPTRLSIYSMPINCVHTAVQRHAASIMFFSRGLGKMGSSPTRMGEALGCGVPIVANDGIGDVAQIITDYRVGVLVRENTAKAMSEALDELNELRSDPKLAMRCRTCAEEVFSLSIGIDAYGRLYRDALTPDSR